MPIYEYECAACGHRLEAIQKFSENPLKKCPECSKLKLKKLISAAAFHLKGSGWYVTDFRDKDKKKDEKPKGKTDGKETKTSDSSSNSDSSKSEKSSSSSSGDSASSTSSSSSASSASSKD